MSLEHYKQSLLMKHLFGDENVQEVRTEKVDEEHYSKLALFVYIRASLESEGSTVIQSGETKIGFLKNDENGYACYVVLDDTLDGPHIHRIGEDGKVKIDSLTYENMGDFKEHENALHSLVLEHEGDFMAERRDKHARFQVLLDDIFGKDNSRYIENGSDSMSIDYDEKEPFRDASTFASANKEESGTRSISSLGEHEEYSYWIVFGDTSPKVYGVNSEMNVEKEHLTTVQLDRFPKYKKELSFILEADNAAY